MNVEYEYLMAREKRIKESFDKLFDVGKDKQRCAICGHIFWEGNVFFLTCDQCRVEIGAMVSPWFNGFPDCLCCN